MQRMIVSGVLAVAVALAIAGSLLLAPASAEQTVRRRPESAVGTTTVPSSALELAQYLMTTSQQAEDAKAGGDYERAVRHFEALAEVVPERAVSYRKICECYLAMGEREFARRACDQARNKAGATVGDQVAYLRILVDGASPLSDSEEEDARAVLALLASASPDELLLSQLERELAASAKSVDYATARSVGVALAVSVAILASIAIARRRRAVGRWTGDAALG